MKKIYYLSTCSTCSRIIKELGITEKNFKMQDIKTEKIIPSQLDEMQQMAGNYEALFSRKAIKYRSLGLDKKELSDTDYRRFILEEYTFLKRPVIIVNNRIFVGNSKNTIDALKAYLGNAEN